MTDNTNNFVFKFGNPEKVEVKTSEKGNTYADFVIAAKNKDTGEVSFRVYGRAFDAAVIAELERATEADMVRVGGFMESNTVEKDGGERTYLRLMTRWVQINKDEPVKAAPKAAAPVEEPKAEAPVEAAPKAKKSRAKKAAPAAA